MPQKLSSAADVWAERKEDATTAKPSNALLDFLRERSQQSQAVKNTSTRRRGQVPLRRRDLDREHGEDTPAHSKRGPKRKQEKERPEATASPPSTGVAAASPGTAAGVSAHRVKRSGTTRTSEDDSTEHRTGSHTQTQSKRGKIRVEEAAGLCVLQSCLDMIRS
jgi:hypothetical protein